LLQSIGYKSSPDQLLAKSVVNILADTRLFAVTDLQNLPLQPKALGNVGRHGDKTAAGLLIPKRGKTTIQNGITKMNDQAEFLCCEGSLEILLHQREITVNLR